MQEEVLKGYRLSPQQRHLWDLLQRGWGFSYETKCAVLLEGELDVDRLRSAAEHLVSRHEILRTSFQCLPGMTIPVQVVADDGQLSWKEHDLCEPDGQDELIEMFFGQAAEPFDFESGPFLRLSLLRLGATRHALLVRVLAVCTDAVGMQSLVRELADAYAHAGGSDDRDVMQYADLAEWQNELIEADETKAGRDYWRERDVPSLLGLRLPFENGVAGGAPFEPRAERFDLDAAAAAKVEDAALDAGTSTGSFLLACWLVLLWRYTGEERIAAGAVFEGRRADEIEDALGLLAKYLPVDCRIDGGLRFAELLGRVDDSAREAQTWQEYFSWEQLVEPSADAVPFLPFCVEPEPEPLTLGAGDISFSVFRQHACIDAFKIKLSFARRHEGLALEFHYDSGLYHADDIRRLGGHFMTLLASAAADSSARVGELEILTDEERHRLLVEFNSTAAAYPRDRFFHELFAAQAAATPEEFALAFEDERLTYRELEERANRLARHLQSLGVGPETLVGLLLERSTGMVVSLLAVLKAGGAYLPLEPTLPPDRLAFMLEDSGARVLLTQSSVLESLSAGGGTTFTSTQGGCHVLCLDAKSDPVAELSAEPVAGGLLPDNLAYVIYTSGSTGTPKAVMIRQRSLTNYLTWARGAYPLVAGGSSPVHSPLSFDLTVTSLLLPLLTGGCVRLLSPGEDLGALVAALGRGGHDLIKLTPAHLQLLAEMSSPAGVEEVARALVVGGEGLPAESARRWARSARVFNEYGPTETVVGCCVYEVGDSPEAEAGRPFAPIGRPIANTLLYVLDAGGRLVPEGVAGELYIGGDGLARGYLNRPALTAERFVPDPFSGEAGARMYRTGDLARHVRGGQLECLGRTDGQVKVRGYRIELGEVEAALREIEGVCEAAACVEESGDGQRRLAGYLVWAEGAHRVETSVRETLRERLPEYMVPARLVWVEGGLPLTGNGKIDRHALARLGASSSAGGVEYVEARDEVEAALARVWQEVLGIERVGVKDRFFDLGGDSIQSIQVVARANRAGLRLTPKQLFQHQTIEELALVVEPATTTEAEQSAVTGEAPLTPVQRWFVEQNLPNPHHFNQSVLLSVLRPLDPALLGTAVEHLLAHHDALRLRFDRTEEGWRQTHAPASGTVPFEFRDLSALDEATQSRTVAAEAARAQRSLNLSDGPVVRVVLFGLGHKRPARLLMVAHHLVVDGVSWRILLEDLRAAYEQLSRGGRVELAAKTTSFKLWAGRLAESARGEELRRELPFWLDEARRNAGRLPLDDEQGANTFASARSISVSLGEEETRALLQDVPKVYRTQINDLLLTALANTLAGWGGAGSVLFELELHGRESRFPELDLSRTVGWFTNIIPVLLSPGEASVPGESLKRVKEQLRGVPADGLGYGMLRYLGTDSDAAALARMPRAEVLFNYLGQFDQVLAEGDWLAPAPEPAGPSRDAAGLRAHLLEINGSVSEGRLRLAWTYSENIHRRETIEAVAGRFVEELRALVAHCLSPEAGGCTPSDFPLARLGQEELDALLRAGVGRADAEQLEDLYPLSPMQQGMLFHSLLSPDSGVYFEQLSCTLRGRLDEEAFERAWRQVVGRYTVLRTSFAWEGLTEPAQLVWRDVRLPLTRVDWSGLNEAEQSERLEELLTEERRGGFDLTQAPLMKLTLCKVDEETHRFVWSHHHLLLDGWCLSIILRDTFELYEAYRLGRPSRLGAVLPYREYIAWLKQQDMGLAERFWREELRGFDAPTQLGAERASGAGEETPEGEAYAEELTRLSEETTAALQSLARRRQLTLNTLAQGGWALLLSRYGGGDDVVFGATVSGRPAGLAGVEDMLGLFINTLPVRVRVPESAGVAGWLKGLQEQQVEMRQYEYSPLVQVQGWSEVPRGLPLFESILVFENYPVDAGLREYKGSLTVGDIRAAERTNYPLTVTVVPGARLLLKIDYDTRRFDRETVSRMLGHYANFLESFANAPDARLADVPTLTADETRQVLGAWSHTERDYPRELCVHGLFEAQVERTPGAVAVVFGEDQLTYSELNARANRLARRLRRLGVGTEKIVGILLERSADMVVAALAVMKAGGAYLPLDPSHPEERLAHMLEDSSAAALLTHRRLLESLPRHAAPALCVEPEETAAESADNLNVEVSPENLLYVIYTSGSTQGPRGVLATHGGIVNAQLAWEEAYALREATTCHLVMANFAFDVFGADLVRSLSTGAKLVVCPPELLLSAPELYALMRRHGVDSAEFVPVVLRNLAEHLEATGRTLDFLRLLIVGSDTFYLEEFDGVRRLCGTRTRFINSYGLTEASVDSTYFESTAESLTGSSSLAPIGRPFPNTEVYVLDAQMRLAPVGVTGELYIGGPGLARGYLNLPGLSAEKFVPHPFASLAGERLYKSGDLVRYLPDGNLEFLGRGDNQVKIRGFRVELGEIEAALRQHEDVRAAVVLAREDTPGDKRLVGYVVYEESKSPTFAGLREFLKERLPEHMVPAVYVRLEELPVSSNGKVNRRALPAPDYARPEADAAFIAPRTPTEEILAGIWAGVLGLERVGLEDDFFDLGGHSLLATQLVSRVRQAFELELPLRSLFEASTLSGFATRVEQVRQEGRGFADLPVRPAPRGAEMPLSFAQQRLWFLDQLEPGTANYNSPAAVRLTGELNVGALSRSLDEIVRRHEALRTNFRTERGRPVQVIQPPGRLGLPLLDLTHLSAGERETRVRALAEEDAGRPFDLTRDTLLRARLLKLSDEEHVVLFTVHHIISDGWSLGVLIREVSALYEAYAGGEESPLPELPIQYADYAAWQREFLQGEVLEAQLSYWRSQLAGELPVLKLPQSRPRPETPTYRGASQRFTFSESLSRAVKELSRREGSTLFMTLLAGFKALLRRYTSQEDLIVGTVVAGRTRAELEPLIGLFINSLVLRTDLSGDPTFKELLRRVREVTLGAYAHQEVPFEKLVEELQPNRATGVAPLFQVAFGLQNAPTDELKLKGLNLSPVEFEQEQVRFDLTVWMSETPGGDVTGVWTYSSDVFDEELIVGMQRHYEQLLTSAVARPELPVSALEHLTAEEKGQLAARERDLTETSYKKFMSVKPKALNVKMS